MEDRDQIEETLDLLSHLEPKKSDAPLPASVALAQFKREFQPTQNLSIWQKFIKEISTMIKMKKAIAPAFALLFIGLFVISPTMRAAASDFLGIFRVQKFAPISISPQQIALLEELAETGLTPGEFTFTEEPGEPKRIDAMNEAKQSFDARMQSPAVLGYPDDGFYIAAGGSGQLKIDLEGARAILAASGADPALLPDSLDQQTVSVTVNKSLGMSWAENNVTLIQSKSPIVEYPEGVDPTALGKALLQVLGMSEPEASRLAASIDWSSTLIFPIPQDAANFQEVTVNGASGLALSSLDNSHSAIMWQENGVVYMLNGDMTVRELNRIANSVRSAR